MNKFFHPSSTPEAGAGDAPQIYAAQGRRLARLKGFAGRHKKAVFLLAAALLAAAALSVWKPLGAGPARVNAPADTAGGGYLRTVTLERTTLENSVSASGTVESAQVSTVTTALTYAVKTVEVQVGDVVSAGDVICTLDTEELLRQIERRQQTADRAVRKAQESLDDAQQNRDEAAEKLKDAEAEEEYAEDEYNAAWAAFNAACDKVTQFRAAYEQAYAALQTALSSYNSVYTPAYQAAETRYEQAEAALREASAAAETAALLADAPDAADPETALQTLDAANAGQDDAQRRRDEAEAELENAKQALEQAYAGAEGARQAYEQAQQQEKAAEEAFTEAKRACNYDALKTQKDTATTLWESAKTARENAENQLEQAEKALASARTALEEAGEDEELETLRRTLADCTLTAAGGGTVTSLDATVGSKCSGTVATIQDTGALKVAFTLAEYDVGEVAVGMQAVVTSDATTEPIAGRLTQISPTTSAAGGGAGNAGGTSEFAAEVTLTGAAEGLRIGMNAKVEIIQSTAEDVFVVPYDAVGENEDGSRYILVKTDAGEGADAFEPVSVTTGAENDYYIEVRGEGLREGMTVRASVLDEASAAQSGAEQAGGDGFVFGMGGGMPGGGMPGGGMGGAPAGGPSGPGGGGMP